MREFLDYAHARATGKGGVIFRAWQSARRDLAVAAATIKLVVNVGDEGETATVRVEKDGGPVGRDFDPPNAIMEDHPGSKVVNAPSPNDLRRSFCSGMIEDGVPHELAAKMMGHVSTAMVSRVTVARARRRSRRYCRCTTRSARGPSPRRRRLILAEAEMGWWKVRASEHLIGDRPLDVLGAAATAVVAEYQQAFGRRPTSAEWAQLLETVMGAEEPEYQCFSDLVGDVEVTIRKRTPR